MLCKRLLLIVLTLVACRTDDIESSQSLPIIYDYSGASSAHSKSLVQSAVDGLGFSSHDIKGPNQDDIIFIGHHYIAWLDQTGFYGKMNGLWILNGESGDKLDFVMRDHGRPVNLFVVGENGDGAFPAGYKGAEHVEFPNRTPEPNDNPNCANQDWCNQYGLNEASLITNPKIPHWSACNQGSIGFDIKFSPIVEQVTTTGIKFIYEGALVKEADGDGNWDGDDCHNDYLFPDGVRRRVNLRVGYELYADKPYLDRTQQLSNPRDNPELVGDMGLIGGFIITSQSKPHLLKHLDWRPESARLQYTRDIVVGWYEQPFSISNNNISLTVSNIGESDNGDTGGCLCVVHDGIELGGGLVHADISLPIGSGEFSSEGRRRLTWSLK